MNTASKKTSFFVPIKLLSESHRSDVTQHLLFLSKKDRYLRFGHNATDDNISEYVKNLDFSHDDLFGIFDSELSLIACAHLAYPRNHAVSIAELGVSVDEHARGQKYGHKLFERAMLHAQNKGIDRLVIQALSENKGILHIASQYGATLERFGSDTEGFLKLPERTFNTHLTEIVEEHMSQTHYVVKLRTLEFQKNLNTMLKKQDAFIWQPFIAATLLANKLKWTNSVTPLTEPTTSCTPEFA